MCINLLRTGHLVLPLSFPFPNYSVTEPVTQGLQCDGLVRRRDRLRTALLDFDRGVSGVLR